MYLRLAQYCINIICLYRCCDGAETGRRETWWTCCLAWCSDTKIPRRGCEHVEQRSFRHISNHGKILCHVLGEPQSCRLCTDLSLWKAWMKCVKVGKLWTKLEWCCPVWPFAPFEKLWSCSWNYNQFYKRWDLNVPILDFLNMFCSCSDEFFHLWFSGWQWYYGKYINVQKGGIGGIAMLLAGYCVLSYIWSYPHLSKLNFFN